MIRLTKLADYGIVLLSQFAKTPGELYSARALAETTHVPLPTVSKLLKKLVNAELLESHRGKSGGYRLARASGEISMADIIEALDGPVHLTECGEGSCSLESQCNVRHHWHALNGVINKALEALHLSELAEPPLVHLKEESIVSELKEITERDYRYGFETEIATESAPPGLSEDIVRFISKKKEEPEWLLDWRLKAYRHWLKLEEPTWAHVHYPKIDYQSIVYFSAPKAPTAKSLADVDPELLKTYEKLGIPLHERAALAGVAVDAVFDSVSVATTFKEKLKEAGVIFGSFSDAVREHPELVQKYLGTVVPYGDNYFAALNSAVFSDGSFCFVPKGVRCPMELSTYFRINAKNSGQFERTLIIAEDDAYVSYLEGCTAPMRDENQLHAAVVELVALDRAEIKYSTVQNWYPGDKNGKGGIYNFVTKRGACRGERSKISWTQVETGSAITWKYPSCILQGDGSIGEFYSVATVNNFQQADTGTKMIHLGKNTKSTIVSKGISAGRGQAAYRGLVRIQKGAENARNYTQCDSLLMGSDCGAHTFPYVETRNPTAVLEHEATTSRISDDQMFYLRQRGAFAEDAVNLIVNGFCKEVFKKLPMEFAVEAQKLLAVSLEGAVG